MNNIVSNCPLCNEHGLHITGKDTDKIMQCLSCGYVSAEKFVSDDDTDKNPSYIELPEDMKKWSKKSGNRFWIPTMITLPFGMLYPQNNAEDVMEWVLAKMIEIPKEDIENYPREDGNGYYTKRFDNENILKFDTFLEGMAFLNETAKEEGVTTGDIKVEKDNGKTT